MKVKWNGNFQEKKNQIWVYMYLTRLFSFSEFMQIPNFLLSASYSSFGQDYSELEISRKDDGEAHSIKETL